MSHRTVPHDIIVRGTVLGVRNNGGLLDARDDIDNTRGECENMATGIGTKGLNSAVLARFDASTVAEASLWMMRTMWKEKVRGEFTWSVWFLEYRPLETVTMVKENEG